MTKSHLFFPSTFFSGSLSLFSTGSGATCQQELSWQVMNARLSRKEEELVMSLHRKKHNYPCLQLHSESGKKSKYAAAALAVANPLLDPRILCSLEKVDKARIAPIIAVELLVLCCLLNPRKLQNDTETLSSQLCYYSFCRVFRIARSCIIKSRAQHNFPVTIV